ncbi:hypothetical protein KW791_03630 [Candidatus Parcubacteria bacterium]|nr:hypothetical protein [Candidatus Parcubacteria bacterium]
MNYVLVLVITIAIQAFVGEQFVISKGQLGPFRIGQSAYEVIEYYRNTSLSERAVKAFMSDTGSPYFEVWFSRSNKSFVLQTHKSETVETSGDDLISSITIFNPGYATESGIHVGATLGQVKKAFEEINVEIKQLDNKSYAVVETLGFWFEVKSERVLHQLSRNENQIVLHDTDIVSAIIIK